MRVFPKWILGLLAVWVVITIFIELHLLAPSANESTVFPMEILMTRHHLHTALLAGEWQGQTEQRHNTQRKETSAFGINYQNGANPATVREASALEDRMDISQDTEETSKKTDATAKDEIDWTLQEDAQKSVETAINNDEGNLGNRVAAVDLEKNAGIQLPETGVDEPRLYEIELEYSSKENNDNGEVKVKREKPNKIVEKTEVISQDSLSDKEEKEHVDIETSADDMKLPANNLIVKEMSASVTGHPKAGEELIKSVIKKSTFLTEIPDLNERKESMEEQPTYIKLPEIPDLNEGKKSMEEQPIFVKLPEIPDLNKGKNRIEEHPTLMKLPEIPDLNERKKNLEEQPIFVKLPEIPDLNKGKKSIEEQPIFVKLPEIPDLNKGKKSIEEQPIFVKLPEIPDLKKENKNIEKQPIFTNLPKIPESSTQKDLINPVKMANPPVKINLPAKETLSKISHSLAGGNVSLTKSEIERIKIEIERINNNQEILNKKIFGSVTPTTTFIVIQVHNRLPNLKHLVKSLRDVQGINETLVIFSHDFWNPTINDFVRNITSFRVMQMFFPFLIQLYPDAFPGRHPQDCEWNALREMSAGCINRGWTDLYGHYREGHITQIKHHWWWKIHRIFEGLKTIIGKNAWAIFLEEDHYVAPDLLHFLRLASSTKQPLADKHNVIALGNQKRLASNMVKTGVWQVNTHNLGYAIGRNVWNAIYKCRELFCAYDDYNWDWTLYQLVENCIQPKLIMLAPLLSRVLHVGSCGIHVKHRVCDVELEVQKAKRFYKENKELLFPNKLGADDRRSSPRLQLKPYGGWGDYRDQQLCQAIGNNNATEDVIRRLQLSRSNHLHKST